MRYYTPVFRFFRRPFKRLKLYLKQKAGWLGVPKIIAYRGYANNREAFITARVVEDSGLTKPRADQNVWRNAMATIKRFSSDEIAGVNVVATFNNTSQTAMTDEYGFVEFRFEIDPAQRRNTENTWFPVQFKLIDKVVEDQPETRATGEILKIGSSPDKIIVSDIDDTIMISYSTQVLKKLRLMLFKNAYTRMPFNGVINFYHSLRISNSGDAHAPFFYVSSSEWNLFDLLDDFFRQNKLPKGVFLLRKLNYSIYKFWKSGGGNHEHKYEQIRSLLQFYPEKKFVLLGDSGQRDPDIYKRLAYEFPTRIEKVYIHKLKSSRTDNFSDYAHELKKLDIHFSKLNKYPTTKQFDHKVH